jgi:hypothetical protein
MRAIKNYLSLFSHLLTPADIEHALQLTAAARKRQPQSRGSVVGDAARHRNSSREVKSFSERFPEVARVPAFAPVPTSRAFIR